MKYNDRLVELKNHRWIYEGAIVENKVDILAWFEINFLATILNVFLKSINM